MANFFDVATNLNLPNAGQMAQSGLLGAIPAALAGMSENTAYNEPAMSSRSQEQINKNMNENIRGPEAYQKELMSGTDKANSLADQSTASQMSNQSLGGFGAPGMQAAIAEKAQKKSSKDAAKLEANSKFKAQVMANSNINTATANAVALANAQRGVEASIANIQLQSSAARYQTISQLMQGAGSVAGLYFGRSNINTPNMGMVAQAGTNFSLNQPSVGSQFQAAPQSYNLGGNYNFGGME